MKDYGRKEAVQQIAGTYHPQNTNRTDALQQIFVSCGYHQALDSIPLDKIILSLGTQCPRYQRYNVCPSLPVRVITKIKLANRENLLQVYVIIEKELVPHSGKNVGLAARRPSLSHLVCRLVSLPLPPIFFSSFSWSYTNQN